MTVNTISAIHSVNSFKIIVYNRQVLNAHFMYLVVAPDKAKSILRHLNLYYHNIPIYRGISPRLGRGLFLMKQTFLNNNSCILLQIKANIRKNKFFLEASRF